MDLKWLKLLRNSCTVPYLLGIYLNAGLEVGHICDGLLVHPALKPVQHLLNLPPQLLLCIREPDIVAAAQLSDVLVNHLARL